VISGSLDVATNSTPRMLPMAVQRLAGVSALATTYGVGELASLTGVAGAYAERIAIVCITGAPPLHATRER
jgi:TPP-dependent 2-oxoacid decarboxylase